jgi:serine/threonine protein kinase
LRGEISRGPFQHEHDYLESLLSAFTLHVKELPLEQHAFFAPIPELKNFKTYLSYQAAVDRWNDFVTVGSKIDSSTNRLDYCIAGHFLREMIPAISQQLFETLGLHGYPICHPDLSSSNTLVDKDFNITCIIDWEFSSTVPISTLLMTPNLPHPRDEIDTTLVRAFRAGFAHHFSRGKDISIDPELWDSTQRAWLFSRLVTLDGLQDYRYFSELYASVYKPEINFSLPKLFRRVREERSLSTWPKSSQKMIVQRERLKRRKKTTFAPHSRREAVARALSTRAKLDEEFVADEELWRRIEEREERGKPIKMVSGS